MMFSTQFSRCRWGALIGLIFLSLATSACSEATDDGGNNATTNNEQNKSGIEIAGTYDSNFDTVETISEISWKVESNDYPTTDSPIIDYDNADNWVVTQNPDDAEYSPGKFNKIVWTEPGADGAFYYCTVDYGQDSAEAAQNTDNTADDSDPANGGCAGMAWTYLVPSQG